MSCPIGCESSRPGSAGVLHIGGTVHRAGFPADLSHVAVSVICRAAVIATLVRIVRSWRDWPCLIDLANRVARLTRCGQPPCAVVSSYRDGGIIRLACPELPALRAAAR